MSVNSIYTIKPKHKLLHLNIREIWQYRDLLLLFIRREIVVTYKQTILGPIWFFVQPILTTIMFLFVFGRLAGIPTDGLPPVVFYLAGITIWNYFQESLRQTSDTFVKNSSLYGKVYFPRVILPVAIVSANLVKFFIQLLLFIVVLIYYKLNGAAISLNPTLLLFPFLIACMGIMGLGFGLIISALTSKYRDLNFLVQFGIQLWMYATPIIYPLSKLPEKYRWIVALNPVTSIVETFKHAFTGAGSYRPQELIYSFCFTIVLITIALLVFNKTEKTFMDTV